MTYILTLFGLLAATGAALELRRRRRRRASLSDEAIRRIEREGVLEAEEPLDLDEARAAEDEFWGETWDEPEEW